MKMLKVSVIGSEGYLGRALCRSLSRMFEVRRVDVSCPNEPNTLRSDVRSQEDAERAVDGVDIVVHLAAYHGGYLPSPTDETRFDVNVVGTFRILQACLKKNVRRLVWASSIAAMDRSNIYSITKVIGEDLCDYFHEGHDFQIAMMRYGSFVSCDLVTYGLKLLGQGGQGVDRRDCVEATMRAVNLMSKGKPLFGRYTVMPLHPYSTEEQRCFGEVWKDVIHQRDSANVDMIQRYGIRIPKSLSQYDLSSTSKDLGFTPQYNFDTFLAELKRRDVNGEITPNSPRWWFEQGVPPAEGVVWPEQETIELRVKS